LLRRVRQNINRHGMVEQGSKVLAAVSGGPDSVALLHILYLLKEDLGISLHVAHLNHMFRGTESEEDAAFVADLAARYDLPATVRSIDVPSYREQSRVSKQAAAREVRYGFFIDTANQAGASKVALAHHADDQAETVLIHFLRGAGITGLKGMLPVRQNFFIRPLLTVRRAEIENFCNEMNLPFRHDPSNFKPECGRNRIRLQLMPQLEKEFNPGIVRSLLRLAEICRDEDCYLEEQAGEFFQNALLVSEKDRVSLCLENLQDMPPAILRRVLRRAWQTLTGSPRNLDFQHSEAVLGLIRSAGTGARAVLPGDVFAVRNYSEIILIKGLEKIETPYFICPLAVPGETFIPELGCTICAAEVSAGYMKGPKELPPEEALLDFDKLPPRIFVRRRQEGDVFNPYGQASPIKLKDFFIKQKIPRAKRDRLPLVSTPGEIIWVGGIRTGEKWKVDGNTKRMLHLRIFPAQAID